MDEEIYEGVEDNDEILDNSSAEDEGFEDASSEQELLDNMDEVLDDSAESVKLLEDDSDEFAEDASEDGTSAASSTVTDEELDQIADTAIAALEDILKYFELGEVTIDEYEGDEGELILDITGDDLAVLIGRHGKTLDALQFVISSITARTMGFRYPVVVDVEGYKGRQRQKLENLAFSAAKRALSQGKSVKMRPMSPYERRLVHIALREFDGVSTASEGEGSGRHVVVVPD